MKYLLILCFFIGSCAPAYAIDPEILCDSIKISEGVHSKFPYGVKSVKVANEAEARRVCLNSVRNNVRRWENAGRPKDFISFMGDRWCPIGAKDDLTGLNRNWIKNVKAIYKKKGGQL